MARILEAVILGAPLAEAIATVEKNVKGDLKSLPSEVQAQVMQALVQGKQAGTEENRMLCNILLEVGRSCALPGSFIGPIAIFYKYASMPNTFVPAVRENIVASDDTCSRSMFIGAVLEAAGVKKNHNSNDSIPEDWIDKMDEETL